MKKIYTKDVSIYRDPDVFKADYESMPAYRKEKIDRYRFDSGKWLSLGVGSLLKQALDELGIEDDPEMIFNKNGKPYLKDHPDIYFSLSHSGKRAMCVIADKPVGCDVQEHENINDPKADKSVQRIVDQYLTDEEKQRPFYDVWALKESYMKATGTGFTEDIRSVPIADTEEYCFELLDIENGYSYAVCMHK